MKRHIIKPIADVTVEKLMYRMLTVDPDMRPTANEVLQDDFFINNKQNIEKIKRMSMFVDEERKHREDEQYENSMERKQEQNIDPKYTPALRQALVKWLLDIQIADKEETHPQTVFLGIDIFDEIMQKWGPIEQDSDLKYIALTCLNIASKYLELGLDLDYIYCWNNQKFKFLRTLR